MISRANVSRNCSFSFGQLWDLVAEREPQILLIDELDKMNAADTTALLSMMEGRRLVRAKKGRTLDVTVPIKVVAVTTKWLSYLPQACARNKERR